MSQTTTPQHSISSQDGVGLGVDMDTAVSPRPLQLPSPAIPHLALGIRFENLSLFTMPDATVTVREVEPSEPSPTDTQSYREAR